MWILGTKLGFCGNQRQGLLATEPSFQCLLVLVSLSLVEQPEEALCAAEARYAAVLTSPVDDRRLDLRKGRLCLSLPGLVSLPCNVNSKDYTSDSLFHAFLDKLAIGSQGKEFFQDTVGLRNEVEEYVPIPFPFRRNKRQKVSSRNKVGSRNQRSLVKAMLFRIVSLRESGSFWKTASGIPQHQVLSKLLLSRLPSPKYLRSEVFLLTFVSFLTCLHETQF